MSATNLDVIAPIRVYACDMYAAQGVEITDEIRANLKTRANALREITGVNVPHFFNLPVHHPVTDERIGYLELMTGY